MRSVEFINSLFSLDGKVVLITGASRGIGMELAVAFAKAGASVYGLGRSPIIANHEFHYSSLNISNNDEVSKFLCELLHVEGKIDVLVNNAGVSFDPCDNIEAENIRFDKTIDINLKSSYLLSIKVLEFMKEKKQGSVINITSIGAKRGFPSNPAYQASKAGLAAITRALAVDYGIYGIRINNLVPGYIHTQMTQSSYDDEIKHNQRSERTMLKSWGEPSDIVGAAIFLASDSSRYLTGSDIVVDGGWCMKGL